VFFQKLRRFKTFGQKKLGVLKKVVGLLPGPGIDLKKFQPSHYERNEKFTFLPISMINLTKEY